MKGSWRPEGKGDGPEEGAEGGDGKQGPGPREREIGDWGQGVPGQDGDPGLGMGTPGEPGV